MSDMYTIRKAVIADKEAVNLAHSRSIREVCHKEYNTEQIEKWSNLTYDDERWRQSIENDFYLVIEKDKLICGFCHAKVHSDDKGEIVGLYLTPEVIGLGAGRTVFERAVNYLRHHNVKLIFIYGTKTAKGFYEAMGFVTKKEMDVSLRGTTLQAFIMEKNL